MAIALKHIREYYMERIDENNYSVVENVHRYVQLVQMYRKMQTILRKEEYTVTVKNGQQEFTKAHPLINDLKNINAQLINLKKEIDRHVKEHERYRIKEESHPEISNSDLLE